MQTFTLPPERGPNGKQQRIQHTNLLPLSKRGLFLTCWTLHSLLRATWWGCVQQISMWKMQQLTVPIEDTWAGCSWPLLSESLRNNLARASGHSLEKTQNVLVKRNAWCPKPSKWAEFLDPPGLEMTASHDFRKEITILYQEFLFVFGSGDSTQGHFTTELYLQTFTFFILR